MPTWSGSLPARTDSLPRGSRPPSGLSSLHPLTPRLRFFFARHDRDRFEVFAYSFGPPDDSPYRRRIVAGCEHFVEVAPLSTPNLARRIAADGIHILVDLMGHTG